MGLGRWGGRGSTFAGVRDMPFPALDFGLDAREYKRGKDGRFSSSGSSGGSKTTKNTGGEKSASAKSKKAKETGQKPAKPKRIPGQLTPAQVKTTLENAARAPKYGEPLVKTMERWATQNRDRSDADKPKKASAPKTKAKEPPAGIQFTTPVRGGRGGGTPATGQFKANSSIRERKPGEEVHWRRDENDPYCPTCGRKTGPDRPWTEKRRPEHTFTSEWPKNEAKDSCPHCGGPLTVATSNDRPAMGRHGGRSSDKAGSRDRHIPKAA